MLASLGAAPALAADPFSGGAAADQYTESRPRCRRAAASGDSSAGTIAAVDVRNCIEGPDPSALASVADFGSSAGGSAGALGVALPVVLSLLLIAALLYALARRRRGGVALAMLLLAALGVPAVSQAAVDLGVATEGSDVLEVAEVERLRLGGARMVRASIDWEEIELERNGPYFLGDFEELMYAASEGPLPSVELLPILFASPAWVKGIESSNEPPRTKADLRAWSAFVERMVGRYKPLGDFWRENADKIRSGTLRYNPVTAWQVWNEPNLSPFWTDAEPDAEQYAEFLKATNAAIKRADPKAQTVLAGMLERADAPLPMSKFLGQLYDAGARADFDVLAPQPFAFVDERPAIDDSLRRVRELADRNGDRDKPIWVTEFGVASDGPKTPLTTDEPGQAAILRGDIALIKQRAEAYGIEKALWFQWRDGDTSPPENPDNKIWQTYTGLFNFEGEPKPSWQAFCALAKGSPGVGPLP